ncbi:MAG: DUF899 domain-containing protein [Alphaproteobacteria bacterium]|nr:DUF899 domain-containing protein [Alphaproteobacteria bacterium]
MTGHPVVAREAFIAARKALLAKEKALTKLRDEVAAARRELPWVRVEKPYAFDTPDGRRTLAELFGARSQLLVYHFMFGPDWQEGCKSCSFWADNFDGIVEHLAARDVSLVAVSRGPLDRLLAFRRRMGWRFPWVSSEPSEFNLDYGVSFTKAQLETGAVDYNYEPRKTSMSELPGVSVFARGADGAVFHTYSCYSRGLDALNGAYQLLDLMPKGRDEAGLSFPMAWVRLHDRYET